MRQANLHGPHLNHGPLSPAILLADVGLSMTVAFHLQVEDCIHSLIIRSLSFLLPPTIGATVKE
jgi:hypothetical protein